jgi:hypothetical protein
MFLVTSGPIARHTPQSTEKLADSYREIDCGINNSLPN